MSLAHGSCPACGGCCSAQNTPPSYQHDQEEAPGIGPFHEEIAMAFEAFLMSRYVPFVADVPEAAVRTTPQRGFFARVIDAAVRSRQRQVEREIARLLEHHGGKF